MTVMMMDALRVRPMVRARASGSGCFDEKEQY